MLKVDNSQLIARSISLTSHASRLKSLADSFAFWPGFVRENRGFPEGNPKNSRTKYRAILSQANVKQVVGTFHSIMGHSSTSGTAKMAEMAETAESGKNGGNGGLILVRIPHS